MSMKGKQNVVYRTTSDEFLMLLVELPKSVGSVLMAMMEEVDKFDNCLQVSVTSIVNERGWDKKNTAKFVRRLKQENVIKEVVDICGNERLMVNPSLVWSTGRNKLRFAVLMYQLGSHEAAIKHKRFEDSLVSHIDPDTGEITGNYQDREEELIKALAAAISGEAA